MSDNTLGSSTITYCGICGKVKNITGDYHGALPNTTSGGSPWCLCSSEPDEESAKINTEPPKPQYNVCDRCHGVKAVYMTIEPSYSNGFTPMVQWTSNNTLKLCLCPPETTKHSGNLDDYDIDHRHAEASLSQNGIVVAAHNTKQCNAVYLDAEQALSLLSWLKQEEATLTKFAEKDNDNEGTAKR